MPGGRILDRYGRELRVVTGGGQSLGRVLADEELAEIRGGPRRTWCQITPGCAIADGMTRRRPVRPAFAAAALIAALTGCATPSAPSPTNPQDAFWAALSSHCGKAYAGQLVTSDAADADLAGRAMVMAVRDCSAASIAVPFHVQRADGTWDRSRTWLVTRTAAGLRLKHDHRHKDGASDAVTMYGGETADRGSAGVQSFPVDAASIAMFTREGLSASVTNVWTVAVDPAGTPGAAYTYQLRRTVAGGAPAERHFRVAFDLTRTIPLPPPAWGWR